MAEAVSEHQSPQSEKKPNYEWHSSVKRIFGRVWASAEHRTKRQVKWRRLSLANRHRRQRMKSWGEHRCVWFSYVNWSNLECFTFFCSKRTKDRIPGIERVFGSVWGGGQNGSIRASGGCPVQYNSCLVVSGHLLFDLNEIGHWPSQDLVNSKGHRSTRKPLCEIDWLLFGFQNQINLNGYERSCSWKIQRMWFEKLVPRLVDLMKT